MIDAKKFAWLISMLSAYFNRSIDAQDIESIYNSIENMYVNKQINQISVISMFDHMLAGRKIDAIKEHRSLTGMGLKESKDEIERIMFRLIPLDKPTE